MKNFKLLPLSAAVMTALCAANAFAENQDVAVLDTVTVTDNQGLKVKSNIVTTQKKDESVETDLRGLLKNEPSISMGGGNGTSQFLYLRGMGQNSIDVKVDNAYSDSQIHYHQGRHMLDPALVKVVSVQKGAGSASAGIGQTNGAIVAKTIDAEDLLKNSSNKNFGAKLNAGYNSHDGYNYGISTFGKVGIVDFVAALNVVNEKDYKAGKGYQNPINGSNKVPFSALDKESYLVKLGLNLDKHRFVLSHMHEQHEGIRTVREEFAVAGLTGGGTSLNGQAPREREMSVSNTNLEWIAKDLGFVESATANVYHLVHGRWSADDSRNGYAGGSLNTVGESTKTKIHTIGANLNLDSRLGDNFLLKYGVNYRHQEVKPNTYFRPNMVNQEKRDIGVYVEGITDIIDKVILTTGLRYDHFNFKGMDGRKSGDGAFNPSVSLIYEPIQNLSFSASHNYATRSPRMADAVLSQGNRGIVSIGQNTKAEKARNTEIGFNYDNGTFAFEGSYFWQHIKDALVRSDARAAAHACNSPTDNCYSEHVNGGTIKNKGYELAASVRHMGFTARLGVAHSQPRFYGSKFKGDPDYAAVIGRTWTASLSYLFEKANLELGVHHRQIEKVKKEDNILIINDTVSAATTGKDGYGVTDITANWKPFGNDKMNVNFAVNNIGNRKYYSHAQRSGGGTARAALYAAGREFRAGVNYTF
ncbi:TonB-dependent receptor domain-containing protein [Mannheimia indoligenes]|uniref:TonB-dependent receptor domain-containing protein n=1 Tax=Mannheimia indoligenes TaxID=3103145 RepID=UPI002FE553A9